VIALLLSLGILSRILSGECGDLGPTAYILTASTMTQRLELGGYGETLLEVAQNGYFASAPPNRQSWITAWALLTGRVPAVGFAFAYSDDDLQRMDWRQGDVVLRRHRLALHLSRREPWLR